MSDSERERALILAMGKYKHRLFRLAVSCLRRQVDAEDVLQEVFLKYYRLAPEFADAEHEKAWLIRVTVNACISLLRSPWRRLVSPIPDSLPAPEPEDRQLIELVCRLPVKYSIPLHLHYYEDYSIKEIASLLHISEGTVKSRLGRARKQLGKLIEKEEYLDG